MSRLVFLQIFQHDFYSALARGQQKFFINIQGERGEIFFKNHDLPIVTNKVYVFIYASPSEIPLAEKEKTAEILSQILDLNKESIFKKLQKDDFYELLKERLSNREIESLKEKNLTGVYFGEEKFRQYPYGSFASHLLGFINKDGKGQYGIEEQWNDVLTGEKKMLEGEWGSPRYFLTNGNDPENKGSDLFLTVDYNIQYLAERLLKKAREQLNIEGGTIMVMETRSGKILALANFPDFNPNQYSEVANFDIFQNSATQKIFEPGSIFKPITMAMAVEEKKVTPLTTYIDRGFVKIGSHTIYNYDKVVWGEQTMTQVLENSINTGAVFVEKELGHPLFLKYIEKFKIFEPTGIDLREIFSDNKEFKNGYEINFATASFGQGIEITPIQMVRAISVIANGGKLVKPYIVEKYIKDGRVIEVQPEIKNSTVISPKTASQLTAMLVSSVENGYAKRAKIPGYYIAGKTGTSQIPFSSLGINQLGYSDKTWQSFVGWLPAFDPKFSILVKLDNPKTKAASFSTTLSARELMKYIIDYYQIPPDYEE